MKLYVYVLEAKNLAVKDSYAKLQIGKFKSKTRVLRGTRNPVWNEEFVFRVNDMDDELSVSVYYHNHGGGDDHSGFFNGSRDLVGRVRIPVSSIAAEENQNLPPTWFSLKKPKGIKSSNKDNGKILLTISLHGRGQDITTNHLHCVQPTNKSVHRKEMGGTLNSFHSNINSTAPPSRLLDGKQFMRAITGRLDKIFSKNEETTKSDDSSEPPSTTLSDYEDRMEETPSSCSFEEGVEMMQSVNDERDVPENLKGGVLLDQTYIVPPKDLNTFLFAPGSQFRKDLAELQGTTDVQEGPWTWKSGDIPCLTRVVTYTKAASKLVKAVKATEEQTYIRADGKEFDVFVSVSTPDVPYGNTFRVELLYKISPGPESSSDEESSRLRVSWSLNFSQSTMMRGMIEGGARQGLKESFDQFANLLAQNFKVLNSADILDKDHVLATLQTDHQSDWELAVEYFWNFTMLSTAFMFLYVVIHIFLSGSSKLKGLEFNGLDLPDSFQELITSGILVLQLERVYNMISRFVQARLRRRSDHGVKAQGDGWVITVALIEGSDLSSLESTEFPDPYVVFTCNGKTRTSSVKLQTPDPQWNEILEFDATDEPPSVLDVEVFDFEGPFDQAASLGHAEINFLKHTSSELADIWVPLEGKLAQSSQSKLHIRIFLDNTNGVETIRDYLTKMEKEVGKKLNLRSPHKNSTFQKIFGLPPEEFLISDFACSLRRKMLLQGRLFLSARIVGFYANFFGHKNKFFFLWEDIEDIQVLPPSLASMGSPTLVIILQKGRGTDARHGAKSQDEEGRLRFYFQSFVPFHVASRTIMGLRRRRALGLDQKAEIAAEQQEQDGNSVLPEDTGSHLVVEDANMSKVYSTELPLNIEKLMGLFDGGNVENNVMGSSGCMNYVTTPWESVKPGIYERRVSYKFNRRVSIFGGDVTCTQQKFRTPDDKGWIINEIMVLHNVPFGDHFHVNLRYEIEQSVLTAGSSRCDVYVGVRWLKSIKFQHRVTRNITEKFSNRLKEIFELVEKQISSTIQPEISVQRV